MWVRQRLRSDDGIEMWVEGYKANIDVYDVWVTGTEQAWKRWAGALQTVVVQLLPGVRSRLAEFPATLARRNAEAAQQRSITGIIRGSDLRELAEQDLPK